MSNEIPTTMAECAAAWRALMAHQADAFGDSLDEAAANTLEHIDGDYRARLEPPEGYRVRRSVHDRSWSWVGPGVAYETRGAWGRAEAIEAAWRHYDEQDGAPHSSNGWTRHDDAVPGRLPDGYTVTEMTHRQGVMVRCPDGAAICVLESSGKHYMQVAWEHHDRQQEAPYWKRAGYASKHEWQRAQVEAAKPNCKPSRWKDLYTEEHLHVPQPIPSHMDAAEREWDEQTCPECNGAGEWAGISVMHTCRACGGKGVV